MVDARGINLISGLASLERTTVFKAGFAGHGFDGQFVFRVEIGVHQRDGDGCDAVLAGVCQRLLDRGLIQGFSRLFRRRPDVRELQRRGRRAAERAADPVQKYRAGSDRR